MPAQADPRAMTNGATPARADVLLTIRTLGGLLDDLERVRVANGNRIAAVERTFGSSLPELDVAQQTLRAIEHQAELQLVRAWRRYPLAPWAKSYLGVGEKSIARLIAIVGDPAERPNVAKLRAYCGFGDPARIKIPAGATQAELLARGNPHAKKQTWLIATAMLKAGNREIYDAARAKYAEAGISDGHAHARAIRAVAKSFLRDLWVAATEIRASQTRVEAQLTVARVDALGGGQRSDEAHRTAAAADFLEPDENLRIRVRLRGACQAARTSKGNAT